MMHGPEKSDPVIVAGKPTNKAERSAAELVEPRTGTKGNADRAKHALDSEPGARVTGAGTHTAGGCRHTPEVGAACGKAARADLCGGREATRVPTAKKARFHRGARRRGCIMAASGAGAATGDASRRISQCCFAPGLSAAPSSIPQRPRGGRLHRR